MADDNRQILIRLAETVDHLVDAVGDPAVSLRRAGILIDIDANPHTTQGAVGDRLNLEKSVVSRNIDWLVDRGCVLRSTNMNDSREVRLQTSVYAHKHMQLALRAFSGRHDVLQSALNHYINLFKSHMPSLRDMKAMVTVIVKGQATRADIVNNLYDGPPTTDQRTLKTLIDEGIIKDAGS